MFKAIGNPIRFEITDASKQCIFVCELFNAMGEDNVQGAKALIEEKFRTVFGGHCERCGNFAIETRI